MTSEQGFVGRRIPLMDVARFTQGRGRYVNDLPFSDIAHVAFARSSEAHARITRIDTRAAVAHTEAIAVITAADLEEIVVNRYWGGWEGTSNADYFPLAREKVRWVGEPVAAVVAPTRYLAEDIAELIEAEYELLPAVTNPERSLEPGSPLLYEDWGHNVYFEHEFEAGDLAGAFDSASGVIRRRFTSQRHTSAPLETRGVVAEYDPTGTLHLHGNWQDVFLARGVIAKVLDMPQSSVRVQATDSGGGFGPKIPVYPEELACCCISVLLERRVKWIQDRQEDLLGTTQARDAIVDLELAHDDQAKLLGLRARILSDGGAYGIPARGNTGEGFMIGEDLTGAYDIPNYGYSLKVAMTNKPPIHPYRGVALPLTIYYMDRMMDELAKATGLDRREVRRRNLIKQFPHRTATGWELEPGSYVESLERALELIEFDGFRDYQRQMREQGRYVGLGIGTGNQAVALGASWYGERGLPISSQEGCRIRVDPTGRVHAQVGSTSQGQGIETVLAQIIADELGLAVQGVRVDMGDTHSAPYGAGAWASRQATLAGSATHLAARKVRDKIAAIAAFRLEASPDDIVLEEGTARVRGNPSASMAIEEIAHLAYFIASQLPPDVEPTLEETAHFEGPPATFPNATHAVILEADRATGAIRFHKYVIVQDAGRILNPLIVDGQLYGGTAQGIGGTILEHSAYTEEGQPLATTFMDYLLPSSQDVPKLELHYLETPSPHTALGVKGVGEAGTCFSPAAIATGVADALGVEVNHLGLAPSSVWSLMQEVEGRRAA